MKKDLDTTTLRGIIFDLDGVIADTEDLHRQAYNLAFEEAGLDVRWSEPDYRSRLHQTAGGKLNFLALPPQASDPAAYRERLYSRKRRFYLQLLETQKLEPRPGVIELIREACERGVTIAAASTCAKEGAEAILTRSLPEDVASAFKTVKAGDDVKNRKPAPDIYLAALDELRLEAGSCVAIEDTVHGLCSAKGAGLWTLVTPSQYTLGDDFAGADWVVEDLEKGGITVSALDEKLRLRMEGAWAPAAK